MPPPLTWPFRTKNCLHEGLGRFWLGCGRIPDIISMLWNFSRPWLPQSLLANTMLLVGKALSRAQPLCGSCQTKSTQSDGEPYCSWVLCVPLVAQLRGGAVWQLVGLTTRRSQVRILPPLPNFSKKTQSLSGGWVFLFPKQNCFGPMPNFVGEEILSF